MIIKIKKIKKDINFDSSKQRQKQNEGENNELSEELEIEQLNLNKKQSSKIMKLGVMIQNEVFGEEELIKEYYSSILQNHNKCMKNFTADVYRQYSVQCCSTSGTLILLSKEQLFKHILNKLRMDQIESLIEIMNSKISNKEKTVQKIKKSMGSFRQYIVSQSVLEEDSIMNKKLTSNKKVRPFSSISYQSQQIKEQQGIQTSRNNIEYFINNEFNNHDDSRTSHLINSFSKNLSLNKKAQSQIEITKVSQYNQNHSSSFLNTPKNQFANESNLELLNSSENQNSFVKPAQIKQPSTSLFFKRNRSCSQKSTSNIKSFSNLEIINGNTNTPQSNKFTNKDLSPIFNMEEKLTHVKKRFSVIEKSTFDSSTNNILDDEQQPRSSRIKLQLSIQSRNTFNSLNITSQEKKLIKFENNLNKKAKQNNPQKNNTEKMSFIQFVPKSDVLKKDDIIISQKEGECPTYSGLNTKVVNSVQSRKMKIKLIQPIFDRGYSENFEKEIIKMNKKNAKHNYIQDVKEINLKKGVDKFTLLQQVIEKQNNVRKLSFYNQESTRTSSFNTNNQCSSNNTNSCCNSHNQILNKDYINFTQPISQSIVSISQLPQCSPVANYHQNGHSFFNNSSILSSPLCSPRMSFTSIKSNKVSSQINQKNIKPQYNIIQQTNPKQKHINQQIKQNEIVNQRSKSCFMSNILLNNSQSSQQINISQQSQLQIRQNNHLFNEQANKQAHSPQQSFLIPNSYSPSTRSPLLFTIPTIQYPTQLNNQHISLSSSFAV